MYSSYDHFNKRDRNSEVEEFLRHASGLNQLVNKISRGFEFGSAASISVGEVARISILRH